MLARLKQWLLGRGEVSSGSTGQERGIHGEKLAADFLSKRGYSVVARNWRNPNDRRDEIDLVCRDAAVLVFVEVKTRSGSALVSGYYAVDKRKKRAVRRACKVYLQKLHVKPLTFRFDVVEVSTTMAGAAEVRHFENVPLFSKDFRA